MLDQLQRHSRGAVRSLREVRAHPVRQASCSPASPVQCAHSLCSQVRQGIASNTKGTAFVVYEDVMDAKQACDKLNGYNFQNRYLVGMLLSLACSRWDCGPCLTCLLRSTLPSARQDDPHKRGPRRPQGEPRTAQEATRYRLTVRRACGQPSESTSFVWRPVFSDIHLLKDKGGFGAQDAEIDRQTGQAGYRHARTEDASLRAEATSHSARVRVTQHHCYQLISCTTCLYQWRRPGAGASGFSSGWTCHSTSRQQQVCSLS